MYNWLDDRAIDPDKPYDAFSLQRLLSNADDVFANRGNHVLYEWDVRTTNEETKHFRPYCSVTKWLTILRVPYYVNPGLKTLKCSILARVSNSSSDADEKSPYHGLPLDIRASLDSDAMGSGVATLLPRISKDTPAWGWYDFAYDVGSEILTSAGGKGGLTYLNLEIRSYTEAKPGDIFEYNAATDPPYIMDSTGIHPDTRGDYLRVLGATFFDEGAALTAPVPGANETCSIAITVPQGDGTQAVTTKHDLVRRWGVGVTGSGGRRMRVDGPMIDYVDGSFVLKLATSYIQPVAFDLIEVYS